MKNILVVGFGAMGCRHVQSLLKYPEKYKVHVVEPMQEVRLANMERIDAKAGSIVWYCRVEDVEMPIDLAIVATSSGPRYMIVRLLIERNVKLFLLEKIVFQSTAQFEDILELMKKYTVKAYCNFVNRYFDAYRYISKKAQDNAGSLQMTVYGGEFGIGCNSIHYIDIFQYLTKSDIIHVTVSDLTISEKGNRRGSQYKEFHGTMQVVNDRGNKLVITSDPDFTGGVVLNIHFPGYQYILSEQTQLCIEIIDNGVKSIPFHIIPTSILTSTVVKEIFEGNCQLTDVASTKDAHLQLFRTFNHVLQEQSEDCLCPIT